MALTPRIFRRKRCSAWWWDRRRGGVGRWLRHNRCNGRNRRYRFAPKRHRRSEEHTSELQSLMRISYAVFCLKKKNTNTRKSQKRHTKNHKEAKGNVEQM